MTAVDDLAKQFNRATARRARQRRLTTTLTVGASCALAVVVLLLVVGLGDTPSTDEREAADNFAQAVPDPDAGVSTSTPEASDPTMPIQPPAGPGNLGADHQTSVNAFRAFMERASTGYARGADWATARSFPIPGTELRGWTYSQAERRCLAVPQPLIEGYGVICRTPQEIANGDASVKLDPGAGRPNLVAVLVDGDTVPTIEAPAGTAAQWAKSGEGVYSGIVPPGSRLVTP